MITSLRGCEPIAAAEGSTSCSQRSEYEAGGRWSPVCEGVSPLQQQKEAPAVVSGQSMRLVGDGHQSARVGAHCSSRRKHQLQSAVRV
jgi:hypothetical protein